MSTTCARVHLPKGLTVKISLTPKFWFLLMVLIFVPVNFALGNAVGFVVAVAVGVGVFLSPARWFD